jgi:3-polyprenyl-4-hydroxybenzoate decarboxylase
MADEKERIIIGVSGATGIVYAARALEILRSLNIETHLVMSKPADLMRSYESALSRKDLDGLADHTCSARFEGQLRTTTRQSGGYPKMTGQVE